MKELYLVTHIQYSSITEEDPDVDIYLINSETDLTKVEPETIHDFLFHGNIKYESDKTEITVEKPKIHEYE